MPIKESMLKLLPDSVKAFVRMAHNKYKGVFFEPYVIRKRISGSTFDFFIGDWVGAEWYDVGKEEWIEMEFIRDHMVKKGDVAFECGGHHGLSTMLLSTWVGDTGKVITFEPTPSNLPIIRKNLELNKIRNVQIEGKAVGSRNGTIGISKSSCAAVQSNRIGTIPIDMVPLDDYIGLKPTLLKIDVEGYEVEVLKGARTILDTRPKLAIEIHTQLLGRYASTLADLLGHIPLKEYKCWVQWSDEQFPEPYDGSREIVTRIHLFAIPLPRVPTVAID
jgi:FkbM family methyltransferase